MEGNKTFRVTLIISMLIHATIFLNPPILRIIHQKSREQKIEINYLQIKPTHYSKLEGPREEIKLRTSQAPQIKKIPPPFIKKDDFFKESMKTTLPKPSLPKPDIISVKKIIQLKTQETEKINNPVYINYYQAVREKIRRCAYQNYSRSDIGQVYLTFIIISDGSLGDVHIHEEKTKANSYLKEIALRSIKDASPFPKFPPQLDYPQLTFNVIISFEIE